MKNNFQFNKCLTTAEMVGIISKYSSIDIALDIINEAKSRNVIKLKLDNKLKLIIK